MIGVPKRRVVAAAVVVALAASLVGSTPVVALFSSGCVPGSVCVTDNNTNVTGQNPNPTAYAIENDANFAGDVYPTGTSINDRVNSIRFRNNNPQIVRVCFYAVANWITYRTHVVATQTTWYDNTSTDLSSFQFRTTSTC